MIPNLREELSEFMIAGRELGFLDAQLASETSAGGKYLSFRGKPILDCTRLDYLGIGAEPRIKSLMIKAILDYDIGCPASQIVTKPSLLADLEERVASWQQLDKAVIFCSGYSTNDNILQALGMRLMSPHLIAYTRESGNGHKVRGMKTLFFSDRRSHYSTMHGIRVACSIHPDLCQSYKFDCTKIETLETQLEAKKSILQDNVGVIVSDTLVSATGNGVDLFALYRLAVKHNCLLYLDEAHAVGSLGKDGRGRASALLDDPGVDKERLMVMGSFTKTFSQMGGFICLGSEALGHMLRLSSPQYIFSAPVLPWMGAVLTGIIDLFSSPWGAAKRESLKSKADYLRSELTRLGVDTMGSEYQLVPALIGSEEKAFELQARLRQRGYHVAVFHYPATPLGKEILRFSVCDDMTCEELAAFVTAFKSVAHD
jgi:7-keto-8-aminopelargonate synthetase-like enzyme